MIAGGVAVALAAVVVLTGVLGRIRRTSDLKSWTSAQAISVVSFVRPSAGPISAALTLPGNLQAFYNAQIFSRVSGYVHTWREDIGAHVKTGELLATIDTPELDQQIEQARADLLTAQANMQLASTTAQRWTRLLAQDAVSKQETDEKSGDFAAKTAQVNAAKANLNRLLALKSFSRIVAPFDGVITARRTDIGALVNAGAGASPTSGLFGVAKVDKLRLYVHVPQSESARIRAGVTATLTVPEFPGRSFPARLDTTADAVSDSSGTLLVELIVDNPSGLLKSGDYAQVHFIVPNVQAMEDGGLILPSSTMIFRNKGVEVAVLDPQNRVRLQHVTVGRNLGALMQVTSGVDSSDRVVNNPPDSISNGELVRIVPPDTAEHVGGAGAAG